MNIDRELKRHFIGRLVENGRRIDGRSFDDFREITIENGLIGDKAEGSSLVKLGNTEVLCGIKVEVGEPFPDTPDEGVLMTGAELVPVAAPDFETGRPGEDAIELARVVDRGLRESKMIDLKKLVLAPGEKVWMVFIDLHILNHDGNLIDASSLAAVSALNQAWIPKYEDEKVVREKDKDLPITKLPVSCTFAKINSGIVLDPILDEEFAMDSRLTITTTGKQVHAMQKGGVGAMSPSEVSGLLDKSMLKYNEIKKLLK
ncbi:MAG: exosome complex protein Rrp42 [Candidatus Altiarchaeota archaeon]|nr:exosome complex protein Rrp42 [Candidatus Altiarchaeota archaeon]